jgi:alkanesulfonate monooxygenase SsuD/methylene tetrahydromethanopterin reductase-like flavin-dependent oxidoreductase (luciferase family)
MDIGIGLPNSIRGASGAVFRSWAQRAEQRGFSGLSTIDRVALPLHDSLVALSVAAGATDRIRLVTNILLGPLYQSALLARASATLDSISGGRLTLGLAVGARQDDYEVTGRPFHTRGRDFDAQLELLHRAWAGQPISGSPEPVCPPPANGERVPILIGGISDAAVRRVAQWGQGWTAGGGGPAATARVADRIRAAWKDAGREGEPRIAALTYFALGADASEAGRSNLLHYYAFAGPYAQRIADGMLASEEAVRDAVRAFEDVGVTELYLDPAAPTLEQVDRLADVVF